jgi:hypothetical protein
VHFPEYHNRQEDKQEIGGNIDRRNSVMKSKLPESVRMLDTNVYSRLFLPNLCIYLAECPTVSEERTGMPLQI